MSATPRSPRPTKAATATGGTALDLLVCVGGLQGVVLRAPKTGCSQVGAPDPCAQDPPAAGVAVAALNGNPPKQAASSKSWVLSLRELVRSPSMNLSLLKPPADIH